MKWQNNYTIILILAVGAVLRFWDYTEVPYINDEFSALFRTEFDSFSELIEKGVKVDGHPPAIQVFLYYWTRWFGTSEWVVKLPFTLLGIGSIYLIYLIGKKWYHETLGLVSASFLACLQHPLMYSQIARPYIAGLFFTLLAVLFWTKYFKSNQVFPLGFVISAVISLYIHHFSALFIFIISISGLFFLSTRTNVKGYFLAGVAIAILYLPNVKILLTQLSYGGLESWLAPPTLKFPFKYLSFLGNFSYYILVLVIGIMTLGFYLKDKSSSYTKKLSVFILWFLCPMVIGYIYSVKVAPILQYTVLLFSFPYLFFILFGHIKSLKPQLNLALSLLIVVVVTLSTVFERKHYSLFYETAFAHVVQDFDQIDSKHKVLALVDSRQKMTKYYQDKLNLTHDFLWLDSLGSKKELDKYLSLSTSKYNQVYFGGLHFSDPNLLPLIATYYPCMEWQKNYATGTTYLFSKEINNSQSIYTERINLGFQTQNNIYRGSETEEWGPSIEFLLDTLYAHKMDLIDVELYVKLDKSDKEVVLVNQIEVEGEQISWNGKSTKEYLQMEDGWVRIINTIRISDLNLPLFGEPKLKSYIWNKDKVNYQAKEFKLSKRKGNPYLYGLFNKLE